MQVAVAVLIVARLAQAAVAQVLQPITTLVQQARQTQVAVAVVLTVQVAVAVVLIAVMAVQV